jgi:peptidoglycan/LPS O-acetylase OafA/YrhL
MSLKMELVSLGTGAGLVAIGVLGYLGSGANSPTALIPSFIGIPFLLVGILVMLKPGTRKHAMHAAAVVALLGLLGVGGRGLMNIAKLTPLQMVSFGGTAVLLIGFLVLAIRSFIEARRARESKE